MYSLINGYLYATAITPPFPFFFPIAEGAAHAGVAAQDHWNGGVSNGWGI